MRISDWSSDVCSSDLEQHVGRVLVHALLHVEALVALLAELAGGVEVALHHVVLAIHWRHALRRLDQDQAVHAVGDVHADRRGGAVVDEQAGVERLEGDAADVTRRGERARKSTRLKSSHSCAYSMPSSA